VIKKNTEKVPDLVSHRSLLIKILGLGRTQKKKNKWPKPSVGSKKKENNGSHILHGKVSVGFPTRHRPTHTLHFSCCTKEKNDKEKQKGKIYIN